MKTTDYTEVAVMVGMFLRAVIVAGCIAWLRVIVVMSRVIVAVGV